MGNQGLLRNWRWVFFEVSLTTEAQKREKKNGGRIDKGNGDETVLRSNRSSSQCRNHQPSSHLLIPLIPLFSFFQSQRLRFFFLLTEKPKNATLARNFFGHLELFASNRGNSDHCIPSRKALLYSGLHADCEREQGVRIFRLPLRVLRRRRSSSNSFLASLAWEERSIRWANDRVNFGSLELGVGLEV